MPHPLESLWAQRYRGETPPPMPDPSSPMSRVLETLIGHRSVRAYRPDPLPDGALEWALAAASSAATSSNMQAWSVVAVEDANARDRMSTLCGQQAHIRQAPLFLAWVADLSRLERAAVAAEKNELVLDYLDFFLVSVVDAAIAAQNAATAFESYGLGTVYIGGARNHMAEISQMLQLPPRAFVAFGMCVGWPDPDHPASIKPRLPQSVVLHKETYNHQNEAAQVAGYDVKASEFQLEQKLPARAWSAHAARHATDHDYIDKRKDLLAVLKQLGFPLS